MLLAWVPFLVLVQRFVTNDLGVAVVNASGGGDMPLLYRGRHVVGTDRTALALGGIHRDPRLVVASPMEQKAWPWLNVRVGLVGWFCSPADAARDVHLKPSQPPSLAHFPGELSPLLQTDLMVVHPPLVFLAYAYCLSIAATAVSSVGQDVPGSSG